VYHFVAFAHYFAAAKHHCNPATYNSCL